MAWFFSRPDVASSHDQAEVGMDDASAAKKAHPAAPARGRSRDKLSRKLLAWWQRLAARGLAYWLIVAALIGVGTFAGKLCEEHDWALQQRYWIYQKFLYLTPRKARAATAVVLVKDKEYWKDLQGRDPISRRYLADLIREIDAERPHWIAIDFNLEYLPRAARTRFSSRRSGTSHSTASSSCPPPCNPGTGWSTGSNHRSTQARNSPEPCAPAIYKFMRISGPFRSDSSS